MQSVGLKETKTFREHCNVTITRVLNTSGANYKINLNRKSEIYYKPRLYKSYSLSIINTTQGLDFLMIR